MTWNVTQWAKKNKFYILVMSYTWCNALVPVAHKLGNAIIYGNFGSFYTTAPMQLIQTFTTTLFSMCEILKDPLLLGMLWRWFIVLIFRMLDSKAIRLMIWGILTACGLGLIYSAFSTVYDYSKKAGSVATGIFKKEEKKEEKKPETEEERKARIAEEKKKKRELFDSFLNNEDAVIAELKKECNSNWVITGFMDNVGIVVQVIATVLSGYIGSLLDWVWDLGCFVGEKAKTVVDVGGDVVGRLSTFGQASYNATWDFFSGKSTTEILGNFANNATKHDNHGKEVTRQILSWVKDAVIALSEARAKGSYFVLALEALPFPVITAIACMGLYLTYIDPPEIPEGVYSTTMLRDRFEEFAGQAEDITSSGQQRAFTPLK
jgi:hypothetical protein